MVFTATSNGTAVHQYGSQDCFGSKQAYACFNYLQRLMRKLILPLLLAVTTIASAQQPGNTPETLRYQEKIRNSADLYYGIEHTGYPQRLRGFAYYLSPDWQKGWVSHKGVLYTDVQLKYDLVADELIVLHPNNVFAVTLFNASVDSFGMTGESFVYVPGKNSAGLKPGYYQRLVNGRLPILAKRSKIIEEKMVAGELEKSIAEKEQFFVIAQGVATTISSEESLLQFMGAQARKVRQHLREKEIRFRKEKELAIITAALFYNQSAE